MAMYAGYTARRYKAYGATSAALRKPLRPIIVIIYHPTTELKYSFFDIVRQDAVENNAAWLHVYAVTKNWWSSILVGAILDRVALFYQYQ